MKATIRLAAAAALALAATFAGAQDYPPRRSASSFP